MARVAPYQARNSETAGEVPLPTTARKCDTRCVNEIAPSTTTAVASAHNPHA
jgi:hypothetical protein